MVVLCVLFFDNNRWPWKCGLCDYPKLSHLFVHFLVTNFLTVSLMICCCVPLYRHFAYLFSFSALFFFLLLARELCTVCIAAPRVTPAVVKMEKLFCGTRTSDHPPHLTLPVAQEDTKVSVTIVYMHTCSLAMYIVLNCGLFLVSTHVLI